MVLDDPFPDPQGLQAPDMSPLPVVDAPQGLVGEDLEMKEELNEEEMAKLSEDLEKKQVRPLLSPPPPLASRSSSYSPSRLLLVRGSSKS